ALSPAETADWNEALDYYGRYFADRPLHDFPMIVLSRGLALGGETLSRLPKPMQRIFEKAAPVYRAHWWPAHDRRNHERMDQLIPTGRRAVRARERRRGRELSQPDLWHAVLFYTTGELVRQREPTLNPYAIRYGMWENNWPDSLAVMEKDWKPFLEGNGGFKQA